MTGSGHRILYSNLSSTESTKHPGATNFGVSFAVLKLGRSFKVPPHPQKVVLKDMSPTLKDAGLSANGWTAVPRSFTKSLADVDKNKQADLSVQQAKPPSSDVAKATCAFAKEKLPEKTFNHSMRVWYYGMSYFTLPRIMIHTSSSIASIADKNHLEWTRLDCCPQAYDLLTVARICNRADPLSASVASA